MSRKREQQREQKKELARQLGVHGSDVPQNLLQNERVTEPRISTPVFVVDELARGFFQKKLPASLRWALWVKDANGARLVGQAVHDVVLARGPVKLGEGSEVMQSEVRYRRPGSFFVGAVVVEGGSVASLDDVPRFHVIDAGAYAASVVVEVKAVDRVREVMTLPLVSADGRLRASLSLDVRL